MSEEKTITGMRFAHEEGRCMIKYSTDGDSVLTCGADGEVRVYKSIDDDDAVAHLIGDETLALATHDEKFYVAASGTNTVTAYNLSDTSNSLGVTTRFTADVTCLDLSADGAMLAAGSEDMTAKVVDIESYKDTHFQGHTAPILSVALDPKKEFLLTSSCDGSVKIWSISNNEKEERSFGNLWPSCNDVTSSKTAGVVSWSSDGAQFAVPGQFSVKLYERDTWSQNKELKQKLDEKEVFGCAKFKGDFVVASTNKGRIVVWEIGTGKLVYQGKSVRGYSLCNIEWHPKKEEVAFIDDHGYWGVVTNSDLGMKVSTKERTKVAEEKQAVVLAEDDNALDEDALAALMDDEDDENSFSIRKIKRDTGFASDDEENSNLSKPEPTGEKDNLDNLFDSDDDGESKPKETPKDAVMMPPPPAQAPHYEVDIQEPFQPGSTPVRLSSRFMVWNSVGLVKAISSYENDESSIEVEFHDAAVHHPIHIANSHGHTMADLSKEAVILACEASEDDLAPSRVLVHHFASSDNVASREWSVEMPGKEEVMAVCTGDGWVAAATDKRQLRIFSVGGMQREVLSLPGPVVAISGHGPLLMATCHVAMPMSGNQSIAVTVLNVNKGNFAYKGSDLPHPMPNYQPLPLAPNSYLSWIGFSDEGLPTTVDSAGIVRIHQGNYGSSWAQVCDIRANLKSKSDNHFVVGLNVGEGNVRSILCKGARYPGTLPHPMIALVPLSLPICEAITERGLLEETYWKQSLTSSSLKVKREVNSQIDLDLDLEESIESQQREALIKLFALAVKTDHESRALEICKLMTDTDTIEIAIKYASKMRRIQLAERLGDLANKLVESQEEEKEDEEEDAMDAQSCRESNVDMFESQPELDDEAEDCEPQNPILAAKMKKQNQGAKKTKSIIPPSQPDARNPFAKKAATGLNKSSGRKGETVFDDMTLKSQSSRNSGGKGFGDRKFDSLSSKRDSLGSKQGTITLSKKANKKSGNTASPAGAAVASEPKLSGFQLWLAENRENLTSEHGVEESQVNLKGLEKWKSLGKEEKEGYKSPRVPKRKRVDDGGNVEATKSAKLST